MSRFKAISGMKRYGEGILNPTVKILVGLAKLWDLTDYDGTLLAEIVHEAMDKAYRRGYTDGAKDSK